MNGSPDQQCSRRQWCHAALRGLALGGIAWLSAELLVRPAGPAVAGCSRPSPGCQGCAALAQCRLPKAVEARNSAPTNGK